MAKKKPCNEVRSRAADKLDELLHCGNERVELSAAKEILALEQEETTEDHKIQLEVSIRIVGE